MLAYVSTKIAAVMNANQKTQRIQKRRAAAATLRSIHRLHVNHGQNRVHCHLLKSGMNERLVFGCVKLFCNSGYLMVKVPI